MVLFQALGVLGYQVDTVCPDKKAGDTVATVIHDFLGEQTYSESQGHNFALTAVFDAVKTEDYEGLFITGGTYIDVPVTEAVVDRNLVTFPAWPGDTAIVRAFAELVGAKITI